MRFWSQSLSERIREAFAFLTESHGYRLVVVSDAGYMGGTVAYRSDDLWITVAWDRSDPWLEFSPTGLYVKVNWQCFELLRRGGLREVVGMPAACASAPELAAYVHEHIGEIELRFQHPQREATLAELAKLKSERSSAFSEC